MFRKIVAVLLALLIVAGAAAAQSDDPSKRIPGHPYGNVKGDSIAWYAPDKLPDSYRLSWKVSKKWRSVKKPNTEKAGNMIVPGDRSPSGKDCYDFGCLTRFSVRLDGFAPPKGSTLCFRVRAIYKGEEERTLEQSCAGILILAGPFLDALVSTSPHLYPSILKGKATSP